MFDFGFYALFIYKKVGEVERISRNDIPRRRTISRKVKDRRFEILMIGCECVYVVDEGLTYWKKCLRHRYEED